MSSIYFNYTDSACPYHRLLLPARYCSEKFAIEHGWEFLVGDGLPPGHDIYVLTGLVNEATIIHIARLKRRGAKFVWSVDDDWKTIPDWNPAKPTEDQLALYDLLKQMADWVMTSTPHLASTFDDIKHKVVCAPNLLDLARFPQVQHQVDDKTGLKHYNMEVSLPVRIVWSGGITHKNDMEVMTDTLERVLGTYNPSQVIVVFQGMAPPPRLLRKYLHRGLFHQPAVPFAAYQNILNSINPHIYLAPLAPVEFNLSKSNLRVIEGWALMATPLASDWGEYRCIQSGEDGRLADTPDEWWTGLNRLIKDHEYRLQLAANGRQRVEAQYSWDNPRCRQPWNEAFTKILGIENECSS